MKTRIFATLILALLTGTLFAQSTLKIGFTNPEYIFQLMPQYKQIESELKSYEKQLQNQLDNKLKEYQVKLEDYTKLVKDNTVPDLVKQDKEKELLSMQNNIKEFEENAYKSMETKQNQLLEPLIIKVQNAIDSVAIENGYNYILNTSVGNSSVILYADKKDDVTELVLKKLGVNVPVKSETGVNTIPNNTGTNTAGTTGTTTPSNTTAPIKKK